MSEVLYLNLDSKNTLRRSLADAFEAELGKTWPFRSPSKILLAYVVPIVFCGLTLYWSSFVRSNVLDHWWLTLVFLNLLANGAYYLFLTRTTRTFLTPTPLVIGFRVETDLSVKVTLHTNLWEYWIRRQFFAITFRIEELITADYAVRQKALRLLADAVIEKVKTGKPTSNLQLVAAELHVVPKHAAPKRKSEKSKKND